MLTNQVQAMIKRLCGEIHLPTLLLCSGCLFSVSGSFPEMAEMIREKWAVAGILAMLFSCGIAILHRKPFVAHMDKVLETFVLLCAIEMGVVAMQLLKILPSYHPFFRFTGTFRNPSVFAMMMALCLPICVFYTVKLLGRNKSLWQFLSICVTLCIFLSESRTCMIAGACSSLAIVFMEVPRFRTCLSNWKVWLPAILFCIILLTALYVYKRDSADGRTLIWTVSLKTLAEKPLAGWGADGFSSSYMPSQAAFLTYPLSHVGRYKSYRFQASEEHPHAHISMLEWLAPEGYGYANTMPAMRRHVISPSDTMAVNGEKHLVRVMDAERWEDMSWKAEYDGNMQTAPSIYPNITLWLKEPQTVTHVCFSPKNADNGICAGDDYELRYWDNGWHTCGMTTPEYEYVMFEDVPQGKLYWLINRSRGQEEMPFVLNEQGEQRFVYYDIIKFKDN